MAENSGWVSVPRNSANKNEEEGRGGGGGAYVKRDNAPLLNDSFVVDDGTIAKDGIDDRRPPRCPTRMGRGGGEEGRVG